jgi:hypothetical protein
VPDILDYTCWRVKGLTVGEPAWKDYVKDRLENIVDLPTMPSTGTHSAGTIYFGKVSGPRGEILFLTRREGL